MMVSIRDNLAVHLEFIWTRQMPGMPWGAIVEDHTLNVRCSLHPQGHEGTAGAHDKAHTCKILSPAGLAVKWVSPAAQGFQALRVAAQTTTTPMPLSSAAPSTNGLSAYPPTKSTSHETSARTIV